MNACNCVPNTLHLSSILTTQRQEHLNVGSRLGFAPIRLRRNEAFRGSSGSPARLMHGDLVAGFPLFAMQEPCHVRVVELKRCATTGWVHLSGQPHNY
jgi:hypothetical protein